MVSEHSVPTSLPALLGVRRGLTAIVGSGGKTTLMYALAAELSRLGAVLVTTSTKIRSPRHLRVANPSDPDALDEALGAASVLCLGSLLPDGKLTAPDLPFDALIRAADYVLAECDGAKGLPGKAHAAHEPVIPAQTEQVITVLGADAFDRPIRLVCHRPERYSALARTTVDAIVTPEVAAAVLRAEGYGNIIYVNKCETPADWQRASEFAAQLACPVVAGSLRRKQFQRIK